MGKYAPATNNNQSSRCIMWNNQRISIESLSTGPAKYIILILFSILLLVFNNKYDVLGNKSQINKSNSFEYSSHINLFSNNTQSNTTILIYATGIPKLNKLENGDYDANSVATIFTNALITKYYNPNNTIVIVTDWDFPPLPTKFSNEFKKLGILIVQRDNSTRGRRANLLSERAAQFFSVMSQHNPIIVEGVTSKAQLMSRMFERFCVLAEYAVESTTGPVITLDGDIMMTTSAEKYWDSSTVDWRSLMSWSSQHIWYKSSTVVPSLCDTMVEHTFFPKEVLESLVKYVSCDIAEWSDMQFLLIFPILRPQLTYSFLCPPTKPGPYLDTRSCPFDILVSFSVNIPIPNACSDISWLMIPENDGMNNRKEPLYSQYKIYLSSLHWQGPNGCKRISLHAYNKWANRGYVPSLQTIENWFNS